MDSQYGIAQSPIGPSPSQSPLAFQPFGSAPSGPPSAYTSALARSTSVSGSGNMSKLSRGSNGSIATASRSTAAAAAEDHDAAPGVAMKGGSPGGSEQPLGLAPLSEDGSSVRSVAGDTSQTDTLQEGDQAAEQSDPPTSPSASAQSPTTSLSPAPQHSQSAEIGDKSASVGVLQPSTDESAPDRKESAHQAGADAACQSAGESQEAADPAADESQDAVGRAAEEPQAAAPSETELQQSMKAVLSGEDQAMQESMAAANAAGGEQLKDALPSPSSEASLTQADCQSPSHPTMTEALSASAPASGSGLQDAPSSPDALPPHATVSGLSSDATAGDEPMSSSASSSVQEHQLEQAEASGGEQGKADAEAPDRTAAGQAHSSGQIADKFRRDLYRAFHRHP